MTAPSLIFILSGLTMIIVSLLRKNHLVSALVTGIFAVLIALFSFFIPLNEAFTVLGLSIRFDSRWILLGRSFILDADNRTSIGYIFLSGGYILIGAWTARPERMFFSLGIATITLVSASLMIEPFLFAAFFIELAAIAGAIILSSRKQGTHRAGLRLLIIYSMAMLAILLVGWLLDINQKDFELAGLSMRAALLLGFGFAVLLAIPPFHSWIPMASGETHPFAWSFISIVLQGAGFFFIIRFLNSYIWLSENAIIYDLLRTIGGTMAILGALWALVQNNILKMASYASIADLGVMLIAFGVGSYEGFQIALTLAIARVLSLACLALGLNKLMLTTKVNMDDKHEERAPLSILGKSTVIIGMLSIAGFPLTAGFPGRWGVLSIISSGDTYSWIALTGSMGILYIAVLRVARFLLQQTGVPEKMPLQRTERLFFGAGIIFLITLGIYPQLIYTWIVQAIEGMIF